MASWQEFSGLNRGYVLDLYEKYRQEPASVAAEARAVFEQWTPPVEDAPAPAAGLPLQKIVGAVNLAQSIRRYGHLAAQLDPLGGRPPGDPSLLSSTHGLTDEDLRALPASLVSGALVDPGATAYDAIGALRRLYCGTSGYDISHVFVPAERDWLRQAAEGGRFRPPADPIHPEKLLARLAQVEAFERFLQRTFPGKTRFSIEGLDMLVPVLDEVISEAAECGIRNILIGMAHRGRLNVMAHVRGTLGDAPGAARFDKARSLPILIHGDAAFPGQGIVAETLNLGRLPGYLTGGTIHIIVNKQLGFPADAGDS